VENRTIREEERRRIELLTRQMDLRRGQNLMDAGSGGGWVAKTYLPKGVFVCAVDLSPKNLKSTREKFDTGRQGGYVVADLYNLPFKENAFDAASSNDVYEHLEYPDQAAAELRRLLRSKGKLFVSVPYKENIVYYLCIHCNQLTPINAHLHSFDEKSLGDIFARNGFAIEKVSKFMNKALAVLQIHYYVCRWMPFRIWRGVDYLANLVIRKPGRMAMVLEAEEKIG
jgi:ubiquinone/menaquinone biosynthesis C-methylase UbiE